MNVQRNFSEISTFDTVVDWPGYPAAQLLTVSCMRAYADWCDANEKPKKAEKLRETADYLATKVTKGDEWHLATVNEHNYTDQRL